MTEINSDTLVGEMQDIKKLMILQLLAIGYKQKQIAAVLGISPATMSRMLPKGFSKESPKKERGVLADAAEV